LPNLQLTALICTQGISSSYTSSFCHKNLAISDHNAVKVEFNNKSKDKKCANSWKLNNSLLKEQWIIDEIKEEIKKFLVNENENTTTGTYGTQLRQS
jgi:hypothetical protein